MSSPKQHQYFAEYIRQARQDLTALQAPDKTKANGTFDYLQLIYNSRHKGQVALERILEVIVAQRPELLPATNEFQAINVSKENLMVNLDFAIQCLEREERGDAELLAFLYENRLLYDTHEKCWHVWRGQHWQVDHAQQVHRLVSGQVAAQYLHTAANLSKDIAAETDPDHRKYLISIEHRLSSRAKKLYVVSRMRNVVEAARRILVAPRLGDDLSIWDSNLWLLGVQNGVIDLKTGKLRRGKPSDWIRTVAPTEWTGLEAKAPRFERFLNEIFDGNKELISFVQRLFGYAITGMCNEHIFPVFYGPEGRNGKDTLLEAIGAVLGRKLAGVGSPDLVIESARNNGDGHATPHLIDLQGARLKWVSETRENARLNVNQIKYITGGGTIKGRDLHKSYVEFSATHTLILLTNHKPYVPSGGDSALWDRMLLIPFNMRFVEKPIRSNERKRDARLKDALAAEASGILAWLVRGCLAYQQEGLNPPQIVRVATNTYQEEQDDLPRFIEKCCVNDPEGTVAARRFHEVYQTWGGKLTETAFGTRMSKLYTKKYTRTGKVYVGVRLLNDED